MKRTGEGEGGEALGEGIGEEVFLGEIGGAGREEVLPMCHWCIWLCYLSSCCILFLWCIFYTFYALS